MNNYEIKIQERGLNTQFFPDMMKDKCFVQIKKSHQES